jgi:adenosylcobinamide kinase/adenosylcobinamide-phosphate guanylyltransferase
LAIHTDPRLREMAFGAWEGLAWSEVGKRYPQEWAAWQADPLAISPPGGETLAQVAVRMQSMFDSIVEEHSDRCVALVSHGGPLRVLLSLALGLPPQAHWRFQVDPASISELCVCDGEAFVVRLNDTAHLARPSGGSSQPELILVLGGARSGKSGFAQRLARDLGGDRVLFVATAEAGDEEMSRRIERHRRERPAEWRTLEVQREVGAAIRAHLGESRVILLDCLSLLVSNLLLEAQDVFADEVEVRVAAEIESLVSCVGETGAHLIVVSNEVGCSLVPDHPLGRAYRDLLGHANQVLARSADQVYVLMAGIPVQIKGGCATHL